MAPPPYTYADKCAALTLMDAGLSLKDITAQLGLSKRTLIRLAAGSALVESMPRRLAAVIENEGEMTKY